MIHRFTLLRLGLATLVLAGIASAQNPHFVYTGASINSSGSLVVSWKEAGLGANESIVFIARAVATAVYGCVNNGAHHPQASNKETFSGPVSATGTFESGKNGSITASLTMNPPTFTPGTFSCPNGQHIALVSVSYMNVQLLDTTTPVTAPISGTYSVVYYQ